MLKTKDELIISWQFSKIHIPLCEITEVTEDNTYAGVEEKRNPNWNSIWYN